MTNVRTSGPAETRLQWIIGALNDPGSVTIDDIETSWGNVEWPDWTPARELEFLHHGHHAKSRPFTIETFAPSGELEATAVLTGTDGKRWQVTCWVESELPHRITRARTMPAPPEGTTIRLATEDDGRALAALERRAPLRLGVEPLTLMTFDHGDDYFAPSRLMEEVTIYVAEVQGQVAGVYCGAVQSVLVDGVPKRLFLEHHVRIDPTTARGGVFWALCNYGRDHYARLTDSIAFYVSVDNHPVRKFVEHVPAWSVRPLRALISCDGATSHPIGSTASAADASAVVDVLNACHEGSALFVPYTDASLGARLSRDPHQYTWSDVRFVAGAAAVGVGNALVTVTKEREGTREVTRRALALDHGFVPGHEQDYRLLLEECCADLASRGATHLAVFTSERSRTFEVLADMADEIEPFDFWAFEIDEPAALKERGFYVDPIYF